MYNFNDWKITDKQHEYIGSGAHWDVYRVYLDEEKTINGVTFSQFIYKRNKKNDKYQLQKNLEGYKLIRETNLPTLAFYFQENLNGDDVIIGEDLNANDLLYVSPNTARNSPKKNIKLIQEILGINEKDNNYTDNAEEILMKNKLIEIMNFDNFIDVIKNDMEKVNHNNLTLCADIFFFGTYKNRKKDEISYKIADFDNITFNKNFNFSKETVLINTKFMLTALWEYAEYFVDENRNKGYKERLENEIKKIEKKQEIYINKQD